MAHWELKYWHSGSSNKSEVERWFNKLTKTQAESVAKELALLAKCGNELRLPHSRSLGKGLFELRERTYGYRLYYTFYEEKIIVLLTAGDKSTQKKDIAKARARLLDLAVD